VGLVVGVAGALAVGHGVDLLIAHASFLNRSDFRDQFIHHGISLADGRTKMAERGVIVRVPLEPDDWRASYFRDDRPAQVAEHVAAIVDDLRIDSEQLPEVALPFVLRDPAVTTVIPGMRKTANVDRDVAVGDGQVSHPNRWRRCAKHRWLRSLRLTDAAAEWI